MLKFNSRSVTHHFVFRVLVLASTVSLGCGCATMGRAWKSLVGGEPREAPEKAPGPVRFSDQDNIRGGADRQYKRMNRKQMEDEAELGPTAGSLWVMEGQGAYLFSQNQMRMVGDLMTVKLEGAAKQQLQTKTKVIAKLLERLENPMRGLASVQNPAPVAASADAAVAPPAADGTQPPAAAPETAAAKPETALGVQTVPTRIVEQLKDGSYRVRGVQPFMIGKREYKVIVSGIVRPADFDEAGVDSGKLLDSQFDIVSSRKGASL